MTRRRLSWLGVAAVVLLTLAVGGLGGGDSASPETRADRLAAGLRCPVCQGLSVRDSDSETARDIRADIARRIEAGETDTEIRQAYVDRYGQWILLRPGGRGLTGLVWWVPLATGLAAVAALAAAFQRWRALRGASVSAADRLLVTRALSERRG